MTAQGNSSHSELAPSTLVGLHAARHVMIAAGVFALSDVVFATIISVKLIALVALAAGVFEVIHGFRTKGWGGFAWQILLGAIYVAFGLVLLYEPALGAVVLTYPLGALRASSGAYWVSPIGETMAG